MIDILKITIKVSRPRFWLYLLGPYLLGRAVGGQTAMNVEFLLNAGYFLLPANVLLYGINDIFDQDTDQYNPKKQTKETMLTTQNAWIIQLVVWLMLGVSAFIWLSQPNLKAAYAFGLFILLSAFYSTPPPRLKARPFFDAASNVLYIMPGLVGYAQTYQSFPPPIIIASAWLWCMGMHIFSAIPDIIPDVKAGIMTTATRLGEKRSLLIVAILWLLAALCILQFNVYLATLLMIYPVIPLTLMYTSRNVKEAYWLFPYINTAIGCTLFLFLYYAS